jgi:hypothetical protein
LGYLWEEDHASWAAAQPTTHQLILVLGRAVDPEPSCGGSWILMAVMMSAVTDCVAPGRGAARCGACSCVRVARAWRACLDGVEVQRAASGAARCRTPCRTPRVRSVLRPCPTAGRGRGAVVRACLCSSEQEPCVCAMRVRADCVSETDRERETESESERKRGKERERGRSLERRDFCGCAVAAPAPWGERQREREREREGEREGERERGERGREREGEREREKERDREREVAVAHACGCGCVAHALTSRVLLMNWIRSAASDSRRDMLRSMSGRSTKNFRVTGTRTRRRSSLGGALRGACSGVRVPVRGARA